MITNIITAVLILIGLLALSWVAKQFIQFTDYISSIANDVHLINNSCLQISYDIRKQLKEISK